MNQPEFNKIPQKSKFLMLDEKITSDPRFYKMGAAMGLYIKLRTFSDKSATLSVSPSCKNLARFVGCSVNTVTNQLKRLSNLGWIRIKHRFNDSNIYSFPIESELLGNPQELPSPKTVIALPQEVCPPTPPKNCDLTRLTLKLESEKLNISSQAKPCTPSPEEGEDIPHSITMPFQKAAMSIEKPLQKPKAGPVQKHPPLEQSELPKPATGKDDAWLSHLLSLKGFGRVEAELLSMTKGDCKAACQTLLRKWYDTHDHRMFYPHCLLESIKHKPRIDNLNAYVHSALIDPDGYERLISDAYAIYQALRCKWRDKQDMARAYFKKEALPPLAEQHANRNILTHYRDRLGGEAAALIDSQKPKMTDPKPRGVGPNEWCRENNWDFREWVEAQKMGILPPITPDEQERNRNKFETEDARIDRLMGRNPSPIEDSANRLSDQHREALERI